MDAFVAWYVGWALRHTVLIRLLGLAMTAVMFGLLWFLFGPISAVVEVVLFVVSVFAFGFASRRADR